METQQLRPNWYPENQLGPSIRTQRLVCKSIDHPMHRYFTRSSKVVYALQAVDHKARNSERAQSIDSLAVSSIAVLLVAVARRHDADGPRKERANRIV